MYSLYKAWLMREYGTPESCGSPNSHVIMTVGTGRQSRQFTGHRHILAEHSGYIKSLLNNCQGNEIIVPNVSPEVFAPLLTFMYTGYLELNSENIYSILLATHLLHMPRAVDLCRSFLLQQQCPQFLHPPTVVKPIPSRKFIPQSGLYWPPPTLPPPVCPTYALPYPSSEIPPPALVPPPAADPVASTSAASPQPPPSPVLSHASDSSSDRAVTVTDVPSPCKNRGKRSNGKVITDIACCDGPVRFRRVLNSNYGRIDSKQENESEKGKVSEEDDKRPVFVCHYCKHTFKSHYCYRKHTRRHINPISGATKEESSTGAVLDLNVQYYPCKTCGSKFPSYYFVHKHRKLCHPNETSSTSTGPASSPRHDQPGGS